MGRCTSDYNSTTAPSGESHTYTISDISNLYYIVTGIRMDVSIQLNTLL
ncbi:MAG: hypothetical protein R2779_09265 [Crocinitomicaceae bacterium]